jgi:hypothetical protein
MPIRAKMSIRFQWRLALIAVFCLGVSLWFLYDGTVAWPKQRERGLVYQELEEEGRLEDWDDIAEERGWPLDDPGEPKAEVEILMQKVLAAVAAPPGILYLVFFVMSLGRWIEASETGLQTSWGQKLDYEQITALDKKKWRNKGIAVVRYEEEGKRKRLTLDDWKYEPDPTEMILREVEARIDPEQIKNGSPEPPLEDLEDEELDEDDLDDEATAEDDDERTPDPDAADEDRH